MKKKVLLTHSYFYKFDQKQWQIGEPFPPLMTITAAALLRKSGYDVSLYDVGLRDSYDDLPDVLSKYNPDFFVVFDDGFNYLTKMCLTRMREAAFGMQKLAKNRGAVVITASSDSTDHVEEYLNEGADFVIKGEAEISLLELLLAIDHKKLVTTVNGVCFKQNDEFVTNKPRAVNRELDQLPQAAWDLVDVDSYRQVWNSRNKLFFLNIATTRGCPYKCNWCAKPIYGNRYNSRNPIKVVDEIEYHLNNHGVDHFWMCDDIFGLKPGWVQSFQKELADRNLNIKYKIQSRADLLLQEDNIDALVGSGLHEVWIGAESGSQRILDAMDKGISLDQIAQSTQILKKKGVRVAFFIQFGYLGEIWDDVKKTIKMVLDLMPDRLGISVSYPLPGTKFYDVVKKDLSTKTNWVDSEDLDMMFENTYSPKFYKRVHRYLHQRYNIKRIGLIIKNTLLRPWSINKSKLRSILSLAKHLPQTLVNGFMLYRFVKVEKR